MLNNKVYNIYQKRSEEFQKKVAKIKKKLNYLSLFRFLSFIITIVFFVLTIKNFHALKLSGILAFFIVFIILIIRYIKITAILNHYKNLIKINNEEKDVLNYKYDVFYDGKDFIDREHPYSYDLDLFGEGSLYQYLNRSITLAGRDLLADRLLKIQNNSELINKKQKAIQELTHKLDWRQTFMATGYEHPVSNDENKKIDFWVKKPVYFIKKRFFRFIVILLPVITFVFFALFILGITHVSWFILLGLTQLLFASILLRRTNQEQRIVSEELRILKNYSKLINLVEKESFKSTLLNELQKSLQTGKDNAQTAFKKLIRIIDAFDTRLNIFLGVILNATLMWDLFSVMRLEKWKLKYGENVKKWVQVITEFDVYSSMANYSFNNPSSIFPTVSENTIFNAKELGHPLIPQSKRVNNDFNLDKPGEIDIITGANMAGKSTFLRTVGVNLILAMNGMTVCAKELQFRIMDIFSGMRTADSLTENESYFYAELKRLKSVIEKLQQGDITFVLLDEILKGTNSVDKAKGSWKFVEYLVKLNATGIVATHDLTLCDLENEYPNQIKNKCFEVEIDGEEIKFDYKIGNGVTQNMNASILMKKMGIFSN